MKILLQPLLSLVLLCLIGGKAYSQTYVYKYHDPSYSGSVYELGEDNSLTLIVTLDSSEPIYADVALHPSGELYGLTVIGSIRQIDLVNGTATEVGAFSDYIVHTAFVCDAEYNFYSLDLNFNLVSFNTETQVEETLSFIGDATSGDLAFYNGHLVYPYAGEYIKAINMDTYEITIIYCIPSEITFMTYLWGVTNSFDTCGNEKLIVANTLDRFFEIDVENDSFEELDVSYDTDAGGAVYGMASGGDLLASQCVGSVTAVDCGGMSVDDLTSDLSDLPFYPNPSSGYINVRDADKISRIEFVGMDGAVCMVIDRPNARESVEALRTGFYSVRIILWNGAGRRYSLVRV